MPDIAGFLLIVFFSLILFNSRLSKMRTMFSAYYRLGGQFPIGEDVANVLDDVLLGGQEQVRHLALV